MSASSLLALVLPLVGVVAAAYLGYRQAVKIADRNAATARQVAEHAAKTEGRRLDVSEWQSLVVNLRQELARVRRERQEDEMRFERRVANLAARVDALDDQREALEDKVELLSAWARDVVRVLRHPSLAAILTAESIEIPPPPLEKHE